jgi:hypothetical protein
MQMFSANSRKDERGLQIFDQQPVEEQAEISLEEQPEAGAEVLEMAPTTTTPEQVVSSTTTQETLTDPQAIVQLLEEQVAELLSQEEFSEEELSKLTEAIDQVSVGGVKGESETASTTEPASPATSADETGEEQGEVLGAEEESEENIASTTQ